MKQPKPPAGSWAEAQAALDGKPLGNNGPTQSGADGSTPGPNLKPKIAIATGNARKVGK